MGVSLTGTRGLSLARIRAVSAFVGATSAAAFFLYGPSVTPVMQAAAVATCNEMTGGNFRSYRLDWVVSATPHWECWDRSDPDAGPVNMGWWVSGR